MTFYLETYSPLLLIDDPMEDEIEPWSEELKRKMLQGFGIEYDDSSDIFIPSEHSEFMVKQPVESFN